MSGFMTYAIKMTTQNMQWPFWALDMTPLKVPTYYYSQKNVWEYKNVTFFEIKFHRIIFLKVGFFKI